MQMAEQIAFSPRASGASGASGAIDEEIKNRLASTVVASPDLRMKSIPIGEMRDGKIMESD